MEVVEQTFRLPSHWTDKFMKGHMTAYIKSHFAAKTAKLIEFKRLPDRIQKAKYEITR